MEQTPQTWATTWEDWIIVARALAAGREHALRLAQTNKPHGKRYTLAMRQWLDANGFDEMTQPERHSCHRVLQNLPAITAWRESLGESHRRKINHPDSAFWGWKRAVSSAPTRRVRQAAPKNKKVAKVFWGQDMIRRAAAAMRESRSSDFFVLARAALEAAIRDSSDLDVLLAPSSPPLMSPSMTQFASPQPAAALHAPHRRAVWSRSSRRTAQG